VPYYLTQSTPLNPNYLRSYNVEFKYQYGISKPSLQLSFNQYSGDVNAVEDMSANAIKILSNVETLNQFKANAKAQSQKFDLHNIVPMYEEIYEETLKQFLVAN
jgi:hypothetical protein